MVFLQKNGFPYGSILVEGLKSEVCCFRRTSLSSFFAKCFGARLRSLLSLQVDDRNATNVVMIGMQPAMMMIMKTNIVMIFTESNKITFFGFNKCEVQLAVVVEIAAVDSTTLPSLMAVGRYDQFVLSRRRGVSLYESDSVAKGWLAGKYFVNQLFDHDC